MVSVSNAHTMHWTTSVDKKRKLKKRGQLNGVVASHFMATNKRGALEHDWAALWRKPFEECSPNAVVLFFYALLSRH